MKSKEKQLLNKNCQIRIYRKNTVEIMDNIMESNFIFELLNIIKTINEYK